MAGMANNEINESFPEGILGMKCEGNGSLYVINEVLNYYQRKLSDLTIQQAMLLPHHMFDLELLQSAKKVLLDLWNWRKCVPSTDNSHIIKGLESKRKVRYGKSDAAKDILRFLEVEDATLGVIFLTRQCEIIPSKILESEAMRDIYVLMHKSESDYKQVMDILEEKSAEIETFTNLVTSMREEARENYRVMTNLLKERMNNNVSIDEAQGSGVSNDNNSSDTASVDNELEVTTAPLPAAAGIVTAPADIPTPEAATAVAPAPERVDAPVEPPLTVQPIAVTETIKW